MYPASDVHLYMHIVSNQLVPLQQTLINNQSPNIVPIFAIYTLDLIQTTYIPSEKNASERHAKNGRLHLRSA